MRQHVIRAREAADLLIGLIRLIDTGADEPPLQRKDDPPIVGRIERGVATAQIENAIKGNSLEPLLAARPEIKAMIAGRIEAFLYEWPTEPDRVIARVPRDADVRVRMLAALAALLPQPGRPRGAKR